MARSLRSDRLAPPLMHAFRAAFEARDARKRVDARDEAGERVIAARRTTSRFTITEALLRREVGRDIAALMNTTNLEAATDLEAFPEVRRSILNFGFPDLVHRTLDEGDVGQIAAEIERALTDFEPRLAPASIDARRDLSPDIPDLKIRFLVRADLVSDPVNAAVEFIADVELDTGLIKVDRL